MPSAAYELVAHALATRGTPLRHGRAPCPAHNGKDPNLAVDDGTDVVLLKCHSHDCSPEAIATALGLTLADLRIRPHAPGNGVSPRRVEQVIDYPYIDATGERQYTVRRIERPWLPKEDPEHKTVRPLDRTGKPGRGGVPATLYNLPELIEAIAEGKRVFFVEGEKKVEELRARGLVATTSGSASSWTSDVAERHREYFRDADLVVLVDNDPPGRKYAQAVADSLLGIAARIRIVELPGLPPAGDVVDFFAAGGTLEQLEAAIVAAPIVTGMRVATSGHEDRFPVVRLLEGEPPEPPGVHVERLAIDRDITLLAASGGHGKSTVLLATAIGVVLGTPVFGTLTVKRPGPVLLVLPEDGQAIARMMLEALIEGAGLGANDRAALGEGLTIVPDTETVNIVRHTRRLARTARDVGAVLLIGDPLRSLLGGEDENDNALAGATCDAIRRDLCRDAELSVMLAVHNRKPGRESDPTGEGSVHEVRGGGGWVNGARLVLGVTKRENRITVVGLKANRVAKEKIRHELELTIEADPNNAAHWRSCRLVDANTGAQSESFSPGWGRPLNPNEAVVLRVLDDTHEPGRRVSWSAWREQSGINPHTWRSVRDRLLEAKLAKAVPTGHRTRQGAPEYVYELAPAGRQALATGRVFEGVDAMSNGETASKGGVNV